MASFALLKASSSKNVDPNAFRIFVGGLRKTTTEDRVHAHFAKYGEVQAVEIKRQPDGSSRGFAFVRYIDLDSVDKAMEAHSQHMIDNKWVDVKRHDSDANAAGPASFYKGNREKKKGEDEGGGDDGGLSEDRRMTRSGPSDKQSSYFLKAAQSMLEKSMADALGQQEALHG
ncbi:unnamed protein product [Polarella glacialis]|uniref:RRM domain-containing protein n=1 Tax=Polarella glacialis TaxID=89957 RepID=A0A813G0Z9_POLGL|nr:unnamed protein product [Polarella glacialis]